MNLLIGKSVSISTRLSFSSCVAQKEMSSFDTIVTDDEKWMYYANLKRRKSWIILESFKRNRAEFFSVFPRIQMNSLLWTLPQQGIIGSFESRIGWNRRDPSSSREVDKKFCCRAVLILFWKCSPTNNYEPGRRSSSIFGIFFKPVTCKLSLFLFIRYSLSGQRLQIKAIEKILEQFIESKLK